MTEPARLNPTSQYTRWLSVTVFDILTDMGLILLPMILTWPLNMPFRWKAQVTVAFGVRVVVVPVSSLHLAYIKTYLGSAEPQLDIAEALVAQQVMLTTSILSACVLNLKSFLKTFYWGYGIATRLEDGPLGENHSFGYELETIGRRPTRNNRRRTLSSCELD